jgi:uncharacterized membrane protein YedE/YeeE
VKASLFTGATGLLFGFSLSRIGFSSWDEVHAMFTFSSLRLVFAFGLAVALLMVAWRVVTAKTGATWSPRLIHPGTIAGGVLFGAGWALSGACPSIGFVQLGEAQFGAAFTLVGVFAGNYLYSVVHERYFRWSTRNCADN